MSVTQRAAAFCELLGTQLPIIQAPVGSISTPELAAAVSNAGGLGMIGVGGMPLDVVEARLRATAELTGRPFGANVDPVPVIAAGGIADGRGVAAVLALGAAAAWIGTRFVCAEESGAHPVYQQLLADAAETDTVHSTLFDGGWPDAPHRTLRNSTVRSWQDAGEPRPGARPGEDEVVARRHDGSEVRRYAVSPPSVAVATGEPEAMAVYAGQGVGLITRPEPAADIVRRLMREAQQALAR